MAKLRSLSQDKLIKILESNGFKQVRVRKHIAFKKTDSHGRIWTTWVPRHKEVTLFVIKFIIRQSGKQRDEFC